MLDRVLQRDCASTLAETFLDFARWNLQTGSRAKESYANAARYPEVSELELSLPHDDDVLRTLPLSTHYFVADTGGPIAAWTNASELSWLLASERADGTLRELKTASAMATLDIQAGERAHVALVDPRRSGNTLRASICIGSPAHVRGCAGSDAGVPPAEIEDAGVSTLDASVPLVDAAVLAPSVDAAIDAPRPRHEDGCTLAHGSYELSWLLLAFARRRRRG